MSAERDVDLDVLEDYVRAGADKAFADAVVAVITEVRDARRILGREWADRRIGARLDNHLSGRYNPK